MESSRSGWALSNGTASGPSPRNSNSRPWILRTRPPSRCKSASRRWVSSSRRSRDWFARLAFSMISAQRSSQSPGTRVAQFSKISGTLAEELARVFKAILIGEGKKRVSGVNAAHEVSRQHILKAFALGAEGLAGRVNAFLKPGHVLAHGLRLAGRGDSGKVGQSGAPFLRLLPGSACKIGQLLGRIAKPVIRAVKAEKRHRAEFGECLLLGVELPLLPDPAHRSKRAPLAFTNLLLS